MDSDLVSTKTSQTTSSPYFKSTEPITPVEPNIEDGDPNIPVGITFYLSLLMGSKVIIFGKPNDQIKNSSALWTFDLDSLKWEIMEVEGSSFLVQNKTDYSVCAYGTFILLFGCSEATNSGNYYATNSNKALYEFFDFANPKKKWSKGKGADMPIKSFHTSVCYRRKAYMFGGLNHSNNATNSLHKLSINLGVWKEVAIKGSSISQRYKHKSLLFKNKLFIFGGIAADSTPVNQFALINLKTRSAQVFVPNPVDPYRGRVTAVFGLANKILIFGGKSKGSEIHHMASLDQDLNPSRNFQIEGLPLEESSSSIFFFNDEFIIQNKADFYKLKLNLNLIEKPNSDISQLAHHMKNLFLDNNYYDIKFKVEDKEIPAYKGILIARCQYFARMFASGMKESQEQVIEVPDMKYEVYYKLIEYLYCDDVEMDKDQAIALLKLSEEYSLLDLKAKCARYLARILKKENFLELAELANTFQANELQDSVVEYFVCYRSSILQSWKIQDLPRYLLEEFIVKYVNE